MNPSALTPIDLGMPPKFRAWRTYQEHAFETAYESRVRHCGLALPTGSGKSLIYMALSQLVGRTAILTSTKTLQDQLMRDFSGLGLVDIRGRGNYPCRLDGDMTCDEGSDLGCHHRFTRLNVTCPYAEALETAKASQLVVTNYSYWVMLHRYGEGLGDFDLLVLDEAHDAMDQLCEALSIEITAADVYRLLRTRLPEPETLVAAWRRFAQVFVPRAEAHAEELKAQLAVGGGSQDLLREYRRWKSLYGRLKSLSEIREPGQWVVEPGPQRHRIVPVWPAPFSRTHLFFDVPHVLLVSATLTRKTMDLLGIPDDQRLFSSYPSTFLPRRYPLIHVPTVRVNHRWSQADEDAWMDRVDEIIEGRRDRKGIIHTVSYDRAKRIGERSRHSELMLLHDSRSAAEAVGLFKSNGDPAILVSPSVSTGHDFPYRQCEYQIISKVPWPDCRQPLMAARVKEDPGYRNHVMCQALVQSCGRGMRAEDDACENFIVDDYIRMVLATCGVELPVWFRRLYRRVETVPAAPMRIEKGDSL